jgi:hypothetical protein
MESLCGRLVCLGCDRCFKLKLGLWWRVCFFPLSNMSLSVFGRRRAHVWQGDLKGKLRLFAIKILVACGCVDVPSHQPVRLDSVAEPTPFQCWRGKTAQLTVSMWFVCCCGVTYKNQKGKESRKKLTRPLFFAGRMAHCREKFERRFFQHEGGVTAARTKPRAHPH